MGGRPRRHAVGHRHRAPVILADTSAWVEYLRRTGSAVNDRMRDAVRAGELAVTDVVLLEILCGSLPHRIEFDQRLLNTVDFLAQHARDDVLHAAELYRHCRSRGLTIRSLNDCLIAAVAIRNEVPVLHADADFDQLAAHTRLQVVPLG
jgi:predicted nucleic acid-binding protein